MASVVVPNSHQLIMNDQFNMREDKPEDVRSLFKAAQKRKEDKIKFHLLAELIDGKTINVTKNQELFEALNRERMDFETIMKLHPEEIKETMNYVKERKIQQDGKWYNTDSKAWWGEKGVIPPCVYYARPSYYWRNKSFVNKFLNDFPKFRIAEGKL